MAQPYPIVANRAVLKQADELLSQFGRLAQTEAAIRADRSRTLGNLTTFCQWRSIERAIAVMTDEQGTGTIH